MTPHACLQPSSHRSSIAHPPGQRLGEIIEEAVELMGDAERNGVPIERLAELIEVSRPTLYRWREGIAILRANRAEGEEE